MNRPSSTYAAAGMVAFVILVAALVLVEIRSIRPEWKIYQERGIALMVERLQGEVDQAASSGERRAALRELATTQARRAEIIEIQPFGGKFPPERCLTCHFGIEDISPSHPNTVFGCVICHGGNGPDLTVRGAHMNLRGGRNPAKLDLAAASCGGGETMAGKCHSGREHYLLNRVVNVPRSLMATNAGIVSVLQFQWGLVGDTKPRFGVRSVSDGRTTLRPVDPKLTPDGRFSLADSHFRKFCAACHLWGPRPREGMGRLEGCPACHAPYAEDGKYHGSDPTVKRDEVGHSATHSLTHRIPDERCRACHNRSGRIGLNYHGEMESSQYGTPFVRGGLNDRTISDDRFVWRLVPDIHHEKGMGCIDCHTGQDAMGDGEIHGHMEDQIEIRCEDCHGSASAPPKTLTVRKDDLLVQALLRSTGPAKVNEGDEVLVTSKGRPLVHVRKTPEGLRLTGKLTGKDHPITVITDQKNGHRIKGHERLECDSCHSAWSPQCYGCHQLLDFSHEGFDHLTGKTTPGRWAEGRSYFRFARNILGINSRGRVGLLVPGCQVWNSVVDNTGNVTGGYDSAIMLLKNGLTSIAVGPTHPHTTRTEVPRCVDCHLDPKAIGLGEGRLSRDSATGGWKVEPVYDSAAAGLVINYPLEAVVAPDGKALQSTSHNLSRPFNQEEIGRILAIGPCLPCHDRYDDPVWMREGPYRLAEPCIKAINDARASRRN
ncbi:MAG: hypothetical protein LDL33_06985 [Desulfomonile sp.]|nr:hypothetical protein [Desulfomonile sp.]